MTPHGEPIQLEPLGPSSDWLPQAACQGIDPELFYSTSPPKVARARGICDRCFVQPQCLLAADRLEHGLGVKMVHGIWGGLTADERIVRRRVLDEILLWEAAGRGIVGEMARPQDA